MDTALTGVQVLQGLGIIALTICTIIAITRYVIRRGHDRPDLTDSFSLKSRTKYQNKQVLTQRSKAFGIGMASSLAFAFVTISWTTWAPEEVFVTDCGIPEKVIEMPITYHKSPPAPKVITPSTVPSPDVVPEVFQEDPVEYKEVAAEVVDTAMVDLDDPPSPIVDAIPAPSPPPLPESTEDQPEEIFTRVEKMPRIGDCDTKECSDHAVMTYIYKHLKYPAIARENDIQGRVTAEFVVNQSGHIEQIKIVRGIGGGCDREVERVLNKLKDHKTWQPGMQRIQPVKVRYYIPVTFSLNK